MAKFFQNASAQPIRLQNGVRTRFQRLSDCRFFSGWVQDTFGSRILVRSSPDVALQNGQIFQFDVYGPELIGAFRAKLEYGGDLMEIEKDESKEQFEMRQRIMAAADVEYEFTIVTEITARPTIEEARYLTQICKAILDTETGEIDGSMIDASTSGIGLILPNPVQKKSRVTIRIATHVGEVKCTAEVRYCRADRQIPFSYRVGLKIIEMDRVALARWSQIKA